MAREAGQTFETGASAEIWIPFALNPLRLVRTPGRSGPYDTVDYPAYNGAGFDLGRAVIAVRWQNDDFFLILPSLEFVSLYNFTFTKDGATWDSQEVLPAAFCSQLSRFRNDLEDAERSFAPLRQQWEVSARTSRVVASVARMRAASEVWSRIQLPEHQKLELLIRAELFEKGDPAAPSGLLLSGPPGTGKGLLLGALAETLDCDFQMLTPADLKHPNLGASGRFVKEMWSRARNRRPVLVDSGAFSEVAVEAGQVRVVSPIRDHE